MIYWINDRHKSVVNNKLICDTWKIYFIQYLLFYSIYPVIILSAKDFIIFCVQTGILQVVGLSNFGMIEFLY